MGRPPRAASTDGIRRQVRRCRWRHNVVVAEAVLLGTVAAITSVAGLLLVLALVTAPRTFAVALVASGGGLVLVEVLVVARGYRTWVRRRAAPAWIDRAAGLQGRLTTLLAVEERPSLLLPLLCAQNEDVRTRWMPERLVPTPFPLLELSAALLASMAFLVALNVAPWLRPSPSAIVATRRAGGVTPLDGLADLAHRVLAAVAPPLAGGETGDDADGATGGAGPAADRTLDHLPAALQASIRHRLWGERWTQLETAAPAGARDAERTAADRRVPGATPSARSAWTPGDDGPGDPGPLDTDDEMRAANAGAAGSGAGTGTDPDLLGTDAATDDLAGGHFALGLAARVFGANARPRRPSGPPAPADADEHPTLGARQRGDEPFHAAPVPPAYAAIVRAVFAHGVAPGDAP